MSSTEKEIYGKECIKWPTNLKQGKKQPRYIALWGEENPDQENHSFSLRYYSKKGGTQKGLIHFDKATSAHLCDFEEARSQGINQKLELKKDQLVIYFASSNTNMYFRDIRPLQAAQKEFLSHIHHAISVMKGFENPPIDNPQIGGSEGEKPKEKEQEQEKSKEKEEEQESQEKKSKEETHDNDDGKGTVKNEENEQKYVTDKGKEENDEEKKEVNEEKKVEENIQKSEDITHKEGEEELERVDQSQVEDKTNSNISSEISKEKTKVEESIVVNRVETESNLKGYGYFSEINSGQDLFYIINENEKTLLGYTREKMEVIHKLESGKILSEEERKPSTIFKLSGEESEVSRVSQSSLHSDTGIKVSFKTNEVVLILCPSDKASKQNEEDLFYALKNLSTQVNIEAPPPPSNGCCTIV